MRSFSNTILVALCCIVSFASCSKKDDPVNPQPGESSVRLEFFNNVGGSSLSLNDQWYTNAHGDSFKVSKFNYYISNIVLTGSANRYAETESYHLLQASVPSSMSFNMAGVPTGTYSSITFTIGVDSLRNVSGAQTGALDPANAMFWTWNTGYIMLKLEGTSPRSTESGGALTFHAGGFTGTNSVVRTVTLPLPNTITVTNATSINHIHLVADVQALFSSPNQIDFATQASMQMPGADAKKFADNYANMFTVSAAGL